MPTPPPTTDDQTLRRVLGELRHRIRRHVVIEALLCVMVFLGFVFWGGLLFDWFFEPSPAVRIGLHGAIAVVVSGMLLWWGVRRWWARLSDQSLARLVEHQHPELAERLSTAVDLVDHPDWAAELHPELVARTGQTAAQVATELKIENVLNRSRLAWMAAGAVGLALSVVALAFATPQVWKTYTERIALSPDRWPRTVELSIEGFQPDGHGGLVRKVARNSDVTIVVDANLAGNLRSPDRVTIRYRWHEGGRGRADLVRIGRAVAGRDASQRYEYLFERISGSVDFSIRGGDDRLRRLRMEVVERPKVTALQFHCEYPTYLGRAPRLLPVSPRVELPEGTQVTIAGKANKPIEQVEWRIVFQDDETPTVRKSETTDFSHPLFLQRNDAEIEVSLLDADGIRSAEPFRVTLVSKRDQSPQLLVVRQGIGTAVTPDARLPLQVTIEDDHGIDAAWVALRVGDLALPEQPIRLPNDPFGEVVALATVDLRELANSPAKGSDRGPFAPGDRITVDVAARDHYDLGDQPQLGKARPLTFEIVTEEELLLRLNGTEQNLRQTFEAIADKLLMLYDALDQMEAIGAESTEASKGERLLEDPMPKETIPSKASVRREADRLAENAWQMADEILGIAAGFEEIHAQLANNRIDNTELFDRIGIRIAVPLRELGSERMSRVANRVHAVGGGRLVSEAKNETRLAIAEVEHLLREMQGLENYNEVIATLREIIRQQERITGKTKDKQKDDLRKMLLE